MYIKFCLGVIMSADANRYTTDYFVLEMQKILLLIKNSKGDISTAVAQRMRAMSIDWLEYSDVEGGATSHFRNNSKHLAFHDRENPSFNSYCENRRKKVFTGLEQADFFIELVNLSLGRLGGNKLSVRLPSKELNLSSECDKINDTLFVEHNGSNHWSSNRAHKKGKSTKGTNNDCLFFSLAHELNFVVKEDEINDSASRKNVEKNVEINKDIEKSRLNLQELADFKLALYVNENPDLSSKEVDKKGYEIRLSLGLEKSSTTPVQVYAATSKEKYALGPGAAPAA